MLSVILHLLQVLFDGTARLASKEEQQRRRDMGTALLMCHLRVSEVLAVGYEIVRELECYVERAERYRARGAAFSHGMSSFGFLCYQQYINMGRFAAALVNAARYLRIFGDDGASTELERLVGAKEYAFYRLVGLIGEGYYYVGTMPLDELFPESFGTTSSPRPAKHILTAMKDASVLLEDEWGYRQLVRVQSYLHDQKPQEQLDDISRVADKLRQLIRSTLPLDDILWSVETLRQCMPPDVMSHTRSRPPW